MTDQNHAISNESIEASAKFWEFLGQAGTAKTIRDRKGFRTTAEVFEAFKIETEAAVKKALEKTT